jgi:hypothetical protein
VQSEIQPGCGFGRETLAKKQPMYPLSRIDVSFTVKSKNSVANAIGSDALPADTECMHGGSAGESSRCAFRKIRQQAH